MTDEHHRHLALLEAFAAAWNAHDLPALMRCVTDDCLFRASSGPLPCGVEYRGRREIEQGFPMIWTLFPDASWSGVRHFVSGERGASEWTFRGTRPDGTRVEVLGCDLFDFRDGRIAVKNTFRKEKALTRST